LGLAAARAYHPPAAGSAKPGEHKREQQHQTKAHWEIL
jgi:hypothetical protein